MNAQEATSDATLLEFFDDMHYDELFRRYAPPLQSWLFRKNDPQVAMEAFAETWFRIKVTNGDFLRSRTKGLYPVRPALFCLAQNIVNQLQAA